MKIGTIVGESDAIALRVGESVVSSENALGTAVPPVAGTAVEGVEVVPTCEGESVVGTFVDVRGVGESVVGTFVGVRDVGAFVPSL